MLGLDTNVLLRYILQDDAEQSVIATHIIEEQCTPEQPGFINLVVLSESVWSLITGYAYSRDQVIRLVMDLLQTDRLMVENGDLVAAAIADMRPGIDLADALIGRRNLVAGCSTTLTFDKHASRLPTMQPAETRRTT